jgi:UDP-N-acetylglucosamine:LPS N-acetylglucosamine transferase
MADYVEQHGCGAIIESVTPEGVLVAIEALVDRYDQMEQAARSTAGGDFAQRALITSYQQVYERVLDPSPQVERP